MLSLLTLLILLVPFTYSACTECVNSGSIWCVESQQCNTSTSSCPTPITVSLNCPTTPKYSYDDTFMRIQQMMLAAAAQNENPQLCFNNQLPTMTLFQIRTVNCSNLFPNVTCVGYTAYDVTQKSIVIAFKGAHGQNQLNEIQKGMENYGLHSYFNNNGKIFKVIYDFFMLLWNGGMQQDIRQLKYKYPDYELWITGHSLGAILGYTASSYMHTIGLYKPEQMKISVMGAGRLGDYDFAAWFTQTFPYSYHIVHRRDPNTRYPPLDPHTNTTAVYHPKTEVWYDNYMKVGDPYQICAQADGNYCSEAVTTDLNPEDHVYYFNVHLPSWAHDGCPKNISAYAQP